MLTEGLSDIQDVDRQMECQTYRMLTDRWTDKHTDIRNLVIEDTGIQLTELDIC